MAIRSDNDPSSAEPRTGLDSGDLEQYGVWVKAEPRDILEGNGSSLAGDIDFDLLSETPAVSEETFLSEDEEKLLGTFDSDFEAPVQEVPSSMDLGPLPDIEDISPRPGHDELGPLDITLEDIESMRSPNSIRASSELDMSTVRGLDSLDSLEPQPIEVDPVPAMAEGMEDVSAQFLDEADVASPAVDRSSALSSDFGIDDVTSEFFAESDDSIPLSRPVDMPQDFEPLDIDLQFEGEDGSSAGYPSERHASEFDDLAAVEASLSELTPPSEAEDLAVPPLRSAPPHASADARSDLSSELLLKIADELRNIRGELVSLKSQIGGLVPSSEPAPRTEPMADKSASGGFFDEEEDETIALTGDELDNILNTADFTEEVAETSSESLIEEPLLPESGDYSPEVRSPEPAIEELRLGETDSVDEIEEIPPEDSLSELVNVSEEGVRAMTSAPEDSSYLEAESLSLDGTPLADIPLVEPDLSEFDLEADDVQGGLEVSEELPLATESPDIKLDLDAGPGYGLDYQADEAEFLEPVPEVEESVYGEISLHEESKDKRPLVPESSIDEVSDVEELEELTDEIPASPILQQEPFSVRPDEVPVALDEGAGIDVAEAEDESASEIEELPEVEEIEPLAVEEASSAEAEPLEAEPLEAVAETDDRLKTEIRSVLSYLDKLLDSLPEEKIEEFARSEYFDTYKRLFEELGLV
jgi:pilus assembly protein FimV